VVGKNAFRILNSFSLSHMNDKWCTKIFFDKMQHLKEKNWRKEHKRSIAIGKFMGVLWSSCGMLWKKSLKNEV